MLPIFNISLIGRVDARRRARVERGLSRRSVMPSRCVTQRGMVFVVLTTTVTVTVGLPVIQRKSTPADYRKSFNRSSRLLLKDLHPAPGCTPRTTYCYATVCSYRALSVRRRRLRPDEVEHISICLRVIHDNRKNRTCSCGRVNFGPRKIKFCD